MKQEKTRQPRTNSIPGPDDITRVELPNGITVLARPNFNSASVMVAGYLQVGALFDKDKKLGLADFTASALMRGTEQRSFNHLYEDLENVGASLGFSGGTHTTGFSGRALVEDLDLLLGILAEALRDPAFPKKEVKKLRFQILAGLALRRQDTRDRAAMVFDEIVYKGHPYSRPDEGHPKTVLRIGLKDLKSFHKKHYGPVGMVVAIVGGIDPLEAVDKVRAVFGDWENPRQLPVPGLPPLNPLAESIRQRISLAGKSQSDLIIGAAGPPRSDPDYLAAAVGDSIFGQFGLMGRIGKAVREEAGLAYYAHSSLNGGLGPGSWVVNAGVDPKNEEKAIELIKAEMQRFTTELVEEDELNDTRANFIGRLPLSLETNAGVAGTLLYIEKHGLGLDYLQRYSERIRAVTRESILAAAARFLDPQRAAVAIAGPPKDNQK
ncbi:MAG: pitrilysin family protein [Anaerolineales bacterium]|jgi:zinc protease